jgi:hypothetical protein
VSNFSIPLLIIWDEGYIRQGKYMTKHIEVLVFQEVQG